MGISQKEVQYVAMLARLNLSDSEVEKMAAEIGSVLEYVARLDTLDLDEIPPTYHTLEISQPLRDDAPHSSLTRKAALENAPEQDGTFFIVPKAV